MFTRRNDGGACLRAAWFVPFVVGAVPLAATAGTSHFLLVPDATLAIIAIAAIASIIVAARQPGRPWGTTTSTDRRVTVTGFDNETGDASLAAIGHVATDWVVQGLAQTQLVDVIGPGVRAANLAGRSFCSLPSARVPLVSRASQPNPKPVCPPSADSCTSRFPAFGTISNTADTACSCSTSTPAIASSNASRRRDGMTRASRSM